MSSRHRSGAEVFVVQTRCKCVHLGAAAAGATIAKLTSDDLEKREHFTVLWCKECTRVDAVLTRSLISARAGHHAHHALHRVCYTNSTTFRSALEDSLKSRARCTRARVRRRGEVHSVFPWSRRVLPKGALCGVCGCGRSSAKASLCTK